MRFGTVCSGIEAPSVAWEGLGWAPQFFSEIEPFPCAVLTHHYPAVPNLGDMNDFTTWPDIDLDLLIGGTPCQSFSVAGLRKGLADPRGNLALVYLALAARARPRWIIWENVPGVLSSNGGRDFGAFLGALVELGYGFAYRILDACFFGVPQRRRRVFVVGYLGDWRRAAAVLFERESLRRDTPKGRKARKDITGTLSARTKGGGGLGTDFDLSGGLIAPTMDARAGQSGYSTFALSGGLVASTGDISHCLNAGGMGWQDYETETLITASLTCNPYADNESRESLLIAHTLRGEGFDASEDGTGRGTPLVAFSCKDHGADVGAIAQTLRANASGRLAVANRAGVRRLTPTECARLQGFPDDFLDITYRGKPAADGPKYRALGNSMAVPVISWLGNRIQTTEDQG